SPNQRLGFQPAVHGHALPLQLRFRTLTLTYWAADMSPKRKRTNRETLLQMLADCPIPSCRCCLLLSFFFSDLDLV
ncbi:MAG: hypothetical protein MK041_10660, partial [Aquabacterium sp.]|nr:hypothetical protein [Aquabacterium sp.]